MQLKRIFYFALVGVGVAALYVLLYLAFLRVGLLQGAANALAFILAVTVQYAGQARFTFQRQLNDPHQMLRFGIMIAGGLITSALITGIVGPYFLLAPWVSAVAVTLILPIQNFILMTLWVFADPAT